MKKLRYDGPSSINDKIEKIRNLTLTDYDSIEISNLNRQFLFWKEDIGKAKLEIAYKSIKEMNPNFNCKIFNSRIWEENEYIFDDNCWGKKYSF